MRLSPRWRVAALYARSATDFNQTVSSTDATGADFDKISNELSLGNETLGSTTSDEIHIVAYRDWPNRSRWTPYAGAGVAVSRTRTDLAWLWARSPDPADITTGLGHPNAEDIRCNLAGTVSLGRRTLRDTSIGYVLTAGLDRQWSERVSQGDLEVPLHTGHKSALVPKRGRHLDGFDRIAGCHARVTSFALHPRSGFAAPPRRIDFAHRLEHRPLARASALTRPAVHAPRRGTPDRLLAAAYHQTPALLP